VPDKLRAEVALESRATLGEGPVWDRATGRLLWVDIVRGLVHSFDPSTGVDTFVEFGGSVGVVAPRTVGGWIVAVDDRLSLCKPGGADLAVVATVGRGAQALRFNDGKADPAGRFWAGTMADDETPGAGTLYRLGPDLTLHAMVEGVTISNGIGWSPDQRTMYFIDTPTRRVDAFEFDLDIGSIQNRRTLLTIERGMPDGMTVDADGGLWVALWDGWAVHRYAPDGRLDRVVELPVARVTSCAFGGDDLDTLFVTSAQVGLEAEDFVRQPDAGSVFAIDAGVSGQEPGRFAG
jgi:sugar lactone lactonase YvrE